MKLISTERAMATAEALLPDPILKMAVRAVLENTAGEVIHCGECDFFQETMGKDSGKGCGYGRCTNPAGMGGIVFADSFCSQGKPW